jgi:Protein of unknown function (DUF3455)
MKRLILFAFLMLAAATAIVPAQNGLEPDLPVGCEQLQVPEGNEVAFRVHASGVQVYWWNGTSWGFVGPIATLYANSGMTGKVGVHYGGPTWKSNSGSLVIGKNPIRCTPDPDSIPWLRLEADETDGSGIFNGVTYIQRLNTAGGKAPFEPGTFDGEEASVPYTTEYYFYRPTGN